MADDFNASINNLYASVRAEFLSRSDWQPMHYVLANRVDNPNYSTRWYLGEPTLYYSACSSYSGIIGLAGFKKDRFYPYQSRWRPELKMAHILPRWTWAERIGQAPRPRVFLGRRGRAISEQ